MILGSTGFLGPYIVASLLDKDALQHVLCVNRNAQGQDRTLSALEQILGSLVPHLPRLHFLVADITRPNFGLPSTSIASLAASVDEVVFNAWNPNWALPREQFSPLIDAVRNAINICNTGQKRPRLFFVSSVCAIGEWPRNHPEHPKIPEAVCQDRADAMGNTYGESKCTAELLLAQASDRLGLDVVIVRAGQIAGEAHPTHRVWPIQGWLYAIINASRRERIWPKQVQMLDWIPVDVLAQGMATIISRQRSHNKIEVYNMVHPRPVSWNLLLETLRQRFGLQAREVSLPKWLEAFDRQKMKLFEFLEMAGSGRESDMAFEMDNARQVLPSVEPISMDQLEDWLSGWDLKLRKRACKL